MPKTMRIRIDDDGINYDLDGFHGDDCFRFTDDLEAALRRDHGVHLEEKDIRRKGGAPAKARNGQTQTGGL